MRLFIGIALTAEARNALQRASEQMKTLSDGRYAASDMYHVTLAYIGECDESMRLAAQSAMQRCASFFTPFTAKLGSPGLFGEGSKAILYAGISCCAKLYTVCELLRDLLAEAGLPFDPKPFIPHITIARKLQTASAPLEVAVESVPLHINSLTLFHSCRVDDVLSYIPIHFENFTSEGGDEVEA